MTSTVFTTCFTIVLVRVFLSNHYASWQFYCPRWLCRSGKVSKETQDTSKSFSQSVILFLYLSGWSGPKRCVQEWFSGWLHFCSSQSRFLSLTVSLLFSNSHLYVCCCVTLLPSDQPSFSVHLVSVSCAMISNVMLLSFHDGWPITHTYTDSTLHYLSDRQLGLCPRITAGFVCVYRADMCAFLWGVGEWAASGTSDWPTGMGARQDADWIAVWRLACRFLCAM